MQVWTMASGKTARIASGKLFRPSTTAISTSSTPRLLSSVMTRSQNFAPSVCSIHSPRISLVPSARTPSATWTALLRTKGLLADLHPQRVKEDQGIDRLERASLPGGDLVQNSIRNRTDQVGRDLDAIQLAQVPDDLPGAHAPGIHRDHLVVEAGKAALILGDQLRIEAGLAITRDLQVQLAGVGHDRLATIAVAAVARLLAGEMMIHLGIQRALSERFLQAIEKAVRIKGRFGIRPGQKLVQDGIRNMRFFASRHVGLLSTHHAQPTHEISDDARSAKRSLDPSPQDVLDDLKP